MNLKDLSAKLPPIIKWIDDTLSQHAADARAVSDFRFPRLPKFYSAGLLASTKVVVVDRVPIPPLTAMGLPEFLRFAVGNISGMSYKDTYFVRATNAADESLHFHELVHVVQWGHLGVDRFLLAYATGLLAHGYRNSPLEVMAYGLQDNFDQNGQPGNVEPLIRARLDEWYS